MGVLCYGGYGMFGWLCWCIVLIGSFIVIIELLGVECVYVLLVVCCMYVMVVNIYYYFWLMLDYWLVFGGCVCFVVLSLQQDVMSGEVFCVGLMEIFLQLCDVCFDYCWGGFVDMM